MRTRPLVFGLCGTAAAAAVAVAGMQLAGGAPAQASGAARAAAATGHVRPGHAVTRADLPASRAESATMVLSVQVGATVTITGDGSRSNCTSGQTSKTVTVTSVPLVETFGLMAKTGGSCYFEPSWSNFQVTATDKGKVIVARTVLLGGANPLSYSASCDAAGGADLDMSCTAAGRGRLDLAQQPVTALKAGGHQPALLGFLADGPGPGPEYGISLLAPGGTS
jgi:hypothetical protein